MYHNVVEHEGALLFSFLVTDRAFYLQGKRYGRDEILSAKIERGGRQSIILFRCFCGFAGAFVFLLGYFGSSEGKLQAGLVLALTVLFALFLLSSAYGIWNGEIREHLVFRTRKGKRIRIGTHDTHPEPEILLVLQMALLEVAEAFKKFEASVLFDNQPSVSNALREQISQVLKGLCMEHPGWKVHFRVDPMKNDMPSHKLRLCDQEWKFYNPALIDALDAYYAIRVTEDLSEIYVEYGDSDAGIRAPEDLDRPKRNRRVPAEPDGPEALRGVMVEMLSNPERFPMNRYGYT
ncbi:MAG: hypothetical protein JJU29_22400 [Verrucomicrobia bacterium]|nr:hypothetical protein [Verrucomicrobiota bacterium]MCH8513178.1 hypothetical protein [Kiritimatiellia bacterium]